MNGELIPGDPIIGQLTRSTVGFLREIRDMDDRRTLVPCGSGVLVEVGGIRGILTAAHVIIQLRKGAGAAALLTITKVGRKARSLEFWMDDCRCVVIGGEDANKEGPDLGFVRVPPHIEERLVDENVFYNFDVRLRNIRAGEPEAPLTNDVLVGVLGERSEVKEVTDTKRIDTHTMVHAYGTTGRFREGARPGFDVFEMAVFHNENVPQPDKSYGGLSGAGVWKVGEATGANQRMLFGIAFFETEKDGNGDRLLICHGPKCIYRDFVDAMTSAFNEFQTPA